MVRGAQHHRLMEDDSVVGSRTVWGRLCHGLGDGACVVKGVTALGRDDGDTYRGHDRGQEL
jgi:hypothetical protein